MKRRDADIEALLGEPEGASPLDRPITLTMFANDHSPHGQEVVQPLRKLRNAILRTHADGDTIDDAKAKLPLFTAGQFKGRYRSSANVQTYEAAHGDYDGEAVSIEEARRLLEAAGIPCILYTSPRHTAAAPRWRVVAPFSRPRPAEEHARMLARLNGVLGGILGPESFDLGRAYYYGCCNGVEPEWREVDGDGRALDLRADLDSGAVGKGDESPHERPAAKKEKVDRHPYLAGIAVECVKRGQSLDDFERAAKAHPIAWDRVVTDETGKARTEKRARRVLERTWAWAQENAEPYFPDMTGVAPGGGDIEHGRAFAQRYRDEFLYIHGARSWARWDGVRWAPCRNGEHLEAAKALAGELLHAAIKALGENDNAEAKRRFAEAKKTYTDHRKLRGMLAMAESEPGIAANVDDFDRDPMLLGVRNGVVDLRDGRLIAPQPDQHIRRQAGAPFDPGASCGRWRAFLETVLPDEELRAFVQRAVGYTLTGLVDEETLIFMHGGGANGKSVFANVLAALFGEHEVTASSELLVKSKHDSEYERERARLPGARLVLVNEVRQGDIWDDRKVKQLTSREKIPARKLYGEGFDFFPTHCTWIRGNSLPGAHDASEAFWRRMIPVHFGVTIPAHRREPDLDRTIIREELSGVLNWAVDGCLAWRRKGLAVPASIEAERKSYKASTDIVGQWLEQRTARDPSSRVLVGDAFEDFRTFCHACGASPGFINSFSSAMKARGFEHRGSRRGARNLGGLRLISQVDQRFREDGE